MLIVRCWPAGWSSRAEWGKMRCMTIEAWALAVPALVALAGFLAKYVSDRRLTARDNRLARTNEQLREFYGPLLSLVSASNSSWVVFRRTHRPGGGYFKADPPISTEDETAWRLWMTTVFMPINRQVRDIVITQAHLLDDEGMPSCLLDLCAHVSAYEAILARWAEGDFSEHKPSLVYPSPALEQYAAKGFAEVKRRQLSLLT